MLAQQRKLFATATAFCLGALLLQPLSVDASRFGFSPLHGFRVKSSPSLLDDFSASSSPKDAVMRVGRGGDQETETLTLDEKVKKAMNKLGLQPPQDVEQNIPPTETTQSTEKTTSIPDSADENCKDGVCAMPAQADDATSTATATAATTTTKEHAKEEIMQQKDLDIESLGNKIADDMNVHPSLAMAALGATSIQETADPTSRKYNEELARSMIQQELELIDQIPEDSAAVQQLVSEGYDQFLARRALAFSDRDMEDARAILLADKLDEEEEQKSVQAAAQAQAAAQQQSEPEEMKTVTVDSNFDPATIGMKSPASAPAAPAASPESAPKPAKKEDVVFEATTAQVQQLVIESPVPVILDIYADWCGPCKALSPILEEMAVKAGGIFRLVKVNSDNERPVSAALEVSALPTIFGIKNGKIAHSFQGMPRSEEAMKNFMTGLLMPGGKFDPPVTTEEKAKYEELSAKLAKAAGAASFTFSQREVLQDRISRKLDALVEARNGDLVDTEETVQILRSLLSNVVRDPSEPKFRKVNLANKVLAAKVAKFKPAVGILKSVGFTQEDSDTLIVGKGKNILNVAPLAVARDHLDKWIDQTRHDVAKAARKRRDEQELKRLEEEGAFEEEYDEEEEEEEVDVNKCELKVRLEGKKKFHEVILDAEAPLSEVVKKVPALAKQDEEMRITCVAKRLIVRSSDKAAMQKSLRDYGLVPASTIVVKVGGEAAKPPSPRSSLQERAAAQKNRKKGSHTMQSIGVYSSEDNAKGELIDGGGGTWYEQDVTSDEEDVADATAEDVASQESGSSDAADAESGQSYEEYSEEE